MTDNLIQALFDILQEYGSSILSTPRMFELVLNQRVKASDKELEAVNAAVRGGAITDLLNSPEMDLGMLAQSLAGRAGVPLHTARWSLEIWQVTLRHAVAGKAPPKTDWESLRVIQPPADRGPTRVVAATLLLIALTGAIAGASPGVLVAIGLERKHPQAERLRNLVEKHEVPGMRMAPREFAAWTGTLGGIGGFLGSALGWLAGGYKHITPLRILGGMIGASWAFDAAAFGMAQYGLVGAFCGPLFAGASRVLLCTLLGPLAILMALVPLSWLVMPHF